MLSYEQFHWRTPKVIMSTLIKWYLVHYIFTKFEKGLSEPEKHYIMCSHVCLKGHLYITNHCL
jgi:hypothetical protein